MGLWKGLSIVNQNVFYAIRKYPRSNIGKDVALIVDIDPPRHVVGERSRIFKTGQSANLI